MRAGRFLWKYRLDAVLMLALFLVAFGIRVQPSDKFSNIFGFDSYWAARMAKYMITGEHSGWPLAHFDDVRVDYPWGRPDVGPSELGWWSLTVGTYKLMGGASTPFNYDLFGSISAWMVAIVGALGVPAIYLLGRVMFNRWAGLAGGLLLAASMIHLSYAIYGHAENDALGLTLLFLALALFALTVKTKSWKVGVGCAAVFAWASIVWQSYPVAVMLVAATVLGYFIITGVYNYVCSVVAGRQFFQDSDKQRSKREWMIYASCFVLASAFLAPLLSFNSYVSIAAGALGLTILLCSLMEIFQRKIAFDLKQPLVRVCIIAVALMVLGGFVAGFKELVQAPLGFVGISVLADGGPQKTAAYEARMLQTIAEQNPVSGDSFFDRLETLKSQGFGFAIWLSFLAVVVASVKLFIMPFVRKQFSYEWDLFMFGFVLFSLFFLTSKSVSMFFLSAPVALGAAYLLANVLRLAELAAGQFKQGTILKAAAAAFILLFAFAFLRPGVDAGNGFSSDVPNEWFQTFKFINTLPKDSVITAWWDYGHWMNYYNGDNVRVTIDNIQDRKDLIFTVASAFTHTTPCKVEQDSTGQQSISCDSSPEALEQAELESLSLLKPLKTTHILVDREIAGGITGGKYGALQHIAGVQTGCMMNMGCTKNADGSAMCVLGKDNKGQDVGLQFTASDWQAATNVTWPGMPLQAYGLNTRLFAKNTSWGNSIYMSALGCGEVFFQGGANANSPVLYAFLERIFFKDPSLKHMKPVFDNGWNVIYEVDWSGVPDPTNFTSWTKDRSVLCTGAAEHTCQRLNKWPADFA